MVAFSVQLVAKSTQPAPEMKETVAHWGKEFFFLCPCPLVDDTLASRAAEFAAEAVGKERWRAFPFDLRETLPQPSQDSKVASAAYCFCDWQTKRHARPTLPWPREARRGACRGAHSKGDPSSALGSTRSRVPVWLEDAEPLSRYGWLPLCI